MIVQRLYDPMKLIKSFEAYAVYKLYDAAVNVILLKLETSVFRAHSFKRAATIRSTVPLFEALCQ